MVGGVIGRLEKIWGRMMGALRGYVRRVRGAWKVILEMKEDEVVGAVRVIEAFKEVQSGSK